MKMVRNLTIFFCYFLYMTKDNKRTHSVHVTLASSNHTDAKRSDNDFYATPPSATKKLLELEKFSKKYGNHVAVWDILQRNLKMMDMM